MHCRSILPDVTGEVNEGLIVPFMVMLTSFTFMVFPYEISFIRNAFLLPPYFAFAWLFSSLHSFCIYLQSTLLDFHV